MLSTRGGRGIRFVGFFHVVLLIKQYVEVKIQKICEMLGRQTTEEVDLYEIYKNNQLNPVLDLPL